MIHTCCFWFLSRPDQTPAPSLFGSATQSRGGIGQYELRSMGKGGQTGAGAKEIMGSHEPSGSFATTESPGDRRFHLALIG